MTFEPNKDYVREILATQIQLRTDGVDYVDDDHLPDDHRSRQYRDVVNTGGAPSELVIELNREANAHEYRDETEGENPIPALRTGA